MIVKNDAKGSFGAFSNLGRTTVNTFINIKNKDLILYPEKYRNNAWQMQINLYNTISRFCHDNGHFVEDSLAKRLINAVVFTVRNAVKTDYQRFLQDIKLMKKDSMYAVASKHFCLRESTKSHRIVFLCLRLHLYFLLYRLYKK